MAPPPLRAGVVVLNGNRLALIERTRGDELYYLLPGGMVEAGESPEQAAKREALEELGLDLEVGPLVAEVTVVRPDRVAKQLYYLATVAAGTFGTGQGEEFQPGLDEGLGTYRAVWRTFDECRALDVRPRVLVDAIAEGALARLVTVPLTVVEDKEA